MKIRSLTLSGFRSFGSDPQTLELQGPLAVIFGCNSHGKSSLVEGIEFLLTGKTTRLQLHDGAKAEFADCLRNVHLPADSDVWVEAVLDIDGTTTTVRRTLKQDLDRSGNCDSRLDIDGEEVTSINAAGIQLSPPPFETPVLMQHAVRFVLSSKPQSRTDYLKQLLEIHDLDDVGKVIASEIEALQPPETPALALLAKCQAYAAFKPALRGLESDPDAASVERKLVAVATQLAPAAGTGEQTLSAHCNRIQRELEVREAAVFPVDEFTARAPTAPSWPGFEAGTELGGLAQEATSTPREIAAVLEAILQVPDVVSHAEAGHTSDCPVCLTKAALTPQRISEVRELLSRDSRRRELEKAARTELGAAKVAIRNIERQCTNALPTALAWAEGRAKEVSGIAAELPLENGAALVAQLSATAEALRNPHAELLKAIQQAKDAVQSAESDLAGVVGTADVKAALGSLDAAVWEFAASTEAYSSETQATVTAISEQLGAASDTAGWREFLALCDRHTSIPTEIADRLQHEETRKELNKALKAIERAKGKVLDDNFADLSEEVMRFWELLRPEEPIRFKELKRRGKGLRYVDMKATLGIQADEEGVVRDAAGVFSDSQLNALGLAVFLARAKRSGLGFLVLDDPVPASDTEHRGAFADKILGELIRDGLQTLVTTHDADLNRRIHNLHDHAGIDGYRVLADDPKQGSVFLKESDDLKRLLLDAEASSKHSTTALLGEASRKVRIAAERLCKEIIVRYRNEDGEDLSVADLSGALGDLVPKTLPFLTKDASHPGKLRNAGTVLNPGSHDDPREPARQELVQVVGDLKYLRKQYCKVSRSK